MIHLLALGVTIAIGSPPVSAPPTELAVPRQYQGEWNTNIDQCGSRDNDSQVAIGNDTIEFYESSGTIRAIVPQGDSELALIAELTGEGDSWLSYHHFKLSDDRAILTDITDGSPGFDRYRCQ